MTGSEVVIAGGGPTGLMLASELALAGTDVVVVERRTSQELDGSRAGGLHARTIEVLDQRGIAERFLSEGRVGPVLGYGQTPLDISDFPTRHNYGLGLWQSHFERILAGWVAELGVPVLRGREVTGFTQDRGGVEVRLSGDASLGAEFLVGCDGGRSLVRKEAGIDFPGLDPTASWMIAEVEMDDKPEVGARLEGGGIGPLDRGEDGGPFRVVLKEKDVEHDRDPTLQDLSEALVAVYGTDYALAATRITRAWTRPAFHGLQAVDPVARLSASVSAASSSRTPPPLWSATDGQRVLSGRRGLTWQRPSSTKSPTKRPPASCTWRAVGRTACRSCRRRRNGWPRCSSAADSAPIRCWASSP